MKRNPQVTAYIASAAPFARPILRKVRALFHSACPGLEEKIKWGCPSFEYKGMLGGMATFKHHAAFGLWRAGSLPDPHGILRSKSPMGSRKLTDVTQLPPDDVMLEFIRAAVELNEKGPPPRKNRPLQPVPKTPDDLLTALRKRRGALANFEAFPPSHRREYIEWITEAKREETRAKRIATAAEWIAEGKPQSWKYAKR